MSATSLDSFVHDLGPDHPAVDRPAEFLLYLRRRRDPEATVIYTAADELDLFLYFFEAGLYVEPDPEKSACSVCLDACRPPPASAGAAGTAPAYITSRTDALDHWHYAQLAAARGENDEAADFPPSPTWFPVR